MTRTARTLRPTQGGFSLLEVMVAVALLSLGLVLLLQVQARSIQLAQQGRDITVATMLARGKLMDCQADLLKKGFSVGDYESDGKFDDEGYPQIYWECHAYKPDMPTADGGDMSGLASLAGGPSSSPGGASGGAAPAGGGLGGLGGAPGVPGADMGMQVIGPILSQMSSVLGDSIRELVVIVRYGSGDDVQELRAATHVIDKTAVNNVAAMIAQQSAGLSRLTGGGAAGGAATPGGTTSPGGVNLQSPQQQQQQQGGKR